MNDFIRGISTVLNLYGNNVTKESIDLPAQSDAEALYSDWQQIGNDLYFAMSECDGMHNK